MRREISKYLKANELADPAIVDKLIVSSFLIKNKISIRFNRFIKSYIISEANDAENNLLKSFICHLEKANTPYTFENLVKLFELVVSPADRVVTGAIYTPEKVREFIVNKTLEDFKTIGANFKLADISCGCGGFLLTATKKIKTFLNCDYATIFSRHIFGLDIEKYSIDRSKILLSLYAIQNGEDVEEFEFNLFVGDALEFSWNKYIKHFEGFSTIVGNPPYVSSRNIKEETRKLLNNWDVCSSGRPDLYIPFFQIALEALSNGGSLGYITMNTFFKSLNGRALRRYFQDNKFDFEILDFDDHQVFNSKSTYTCICIIKKKQSETLSYIKMQSVEDLENEVGNPAIILYSSLKSSSGWNLKFTGLINHIEQVGKPFSEVYRTRNGIATLKNDVFIFKPVKEDRRYLYLENGLVYKIEKNLCKDVFNPNLLITKRNLSELKEKLIFPYTFEGSTTKILSERALKDIYPQAYQYLNTKREILAERDKGNGDYEKWFAFGRTQSLEKIKFKLFFPHIAPSVPNYVINQDENLFFYNGIAVVGTSRNELILLKKIMTSRLFWFYLKQTSKPYGSGYISMSKNYIRNFGIYQFTRDDIEYILREDKIEKLNLFLEKKYEVTLPTNF